MKIINHWSLLILFLVSIFQLSCSKDDDITKEIPCHKTVMHGKWDVVSELNNYYEEQDSTVVSMNSYTILYDEDGRGNFEGGIAHFTWTLQCNPDRLLRNDLGGPPLEETGEDPMDYVALANIYLINKITIDEIQMSAEYYLGNNDTRRKVTDNLTYTRVE